MTEKEFSKLIRTNILGEYIDRDGDISVMYIDFVESEQTFVAGTMCNIGLIAKVSLPFDEYYTLDQHIEVLHELIGEQGYYLNS